MLSGVLSSETAIKVNIQIMRVFVWMRKMIESHGAILKKLENLERKDLEQDKKIRVIFDYIKQLENAKSQLLDPKKRKPIGFKQTSK